MMEDMKNNSVLYTPRQVATFYSIRKDTLLYYDRIGLFRPEIRKENGYRYYSASQLAELDTILTLRDLDFPIPAIKEALKDLNPGSFVELMEREEESIRRKIDAYESLMKVVQRIRRGVSDASKAEKGRLYISQESRTYILREPIAVYDQTHSDDEEWENAYRRLIATADGKAMMNVGSIVRLDEARAYLGSLCREVYITYAKPTRWSIPAGRYAYMYFQGPLSGLRSFYSAFLKALDDDGLVPEGDIYEELTISSLSSRDESEHVTKLMVRLEDSSEDK